MRSKLTYLLFALLAVPPARGSASRQKVVAVQPSAHAMVSAETRQTVVDFDQAVDPASLDARAFTVFGR